MDKRLVIASHNEGKVREIGELLAFVSRNGDCVHQLSSDLESFGGQWARLRAGPRLVKV